MTKQMKRKRSTSNDDDQTLSINTTRTTRSSQEHQQQHHQHDQPQQQHQAADVYSRTLVSSTKGRGSLSGWTICPLCNGKQKKFALGRGISMHLQQCHTPWNPGKGELARRERLRRRIDGFVYRTFKTQDGSASASASASASGSGSRNGHANEHDSSTDDVLGNVPIVQEAETRISYKERLLKHYLGNACWDRDGKKRPTCYTPNEQEIQQWSMKLIQITKELEHSCCQEESESKSESKAKATTTNKKRDASSENETEESIHVHVLKPGFDRHGNESKSYKESLPPFVKAASDGNLELLQQLVQDATLTCKSISQQPQNQSDVHSNVNASAIAMAKLKLLETKDRNGSTAEHWSAGNGHLKCLQYLMSLATDVVSEKNCNSNGNSRDAFSDKKRRKRDGKTSLHYASRNGHTAVIKYLLNSAHFKPHIDVISGDGTTPLHMAFFGGHLEAIQCLVENKADIYKQNAWECGIGHWIALSIQSDHERLVQILNYMKGLVVDVDGIGSTSTSTFKFFGVVQKQGHSAVHKAAQKRNKAVIKWLVDEASSWPPEQRDIAGGKDACGNKPSDIWVQMGGDECYSKWLREECGW